MFSSMHYLQSVEDRGEFSVPSCYGNIKHDNGGSSLTFEHPLDDVNVVDLKWIHDFVLKSLEVLYQVEKWETLVSLAIQFNAVSHERYTEQVTPLLVFAQRQLLLRVLKFKGPDVAQQACARYEAEHGEKITCRNFVGKQLKINSSATELIDPGDGADFLRKLIDAEYSHAKALVCVPVDVTDTLRCFRETLEKSKYHSRSIRHSRKLLSLLLAQTQDVLQASNQRSLKVQALHTLGSLLIFAGKNRAAFKCWCQALDDIFRKPDVLQTWKELGPAPASTASSRTVPGSRDYSEAFLSMVGIWGCLQGAVVSAKIAQFIKSLDVGKRTDCCLLSALLFQGLLRTTLPHPTVERSYAQYEVSQLLPGLELFSDRFRADLCSVVASLYYVIRELHFVKHDLIVLPLLALYQYFVSGICQDLVRSLEARLLKVEVLTDLGFFSEAFHELSQIFYGRNMPCAISTGCKATGKTKTLQSFDSGKPLSSKENIQALDELINKNMPLTLMTIGQQHLLNKFYFVKAYFFISVAATINCVPDSASRMPYLGPLADRNRPNLQSLKELYSKEDRGSFCQFTRARNESILSTLKAVLLTEAEEQLNTLVSELEQPGCGSLAKCTARELEVMVRAQLQLAAVALQRHRAAYSAAIVYSTLRLLQDSKLFLKKGVRDVTENPLSPGASAAENKDDPEFLDPISLNAREYFSIHLWLRCRLALVTAFIAQIRGIGIVKEDDVTDCMGLIKEVCSEARGAGDAELQAELLTQAVVLGLQEKHLKADITGHLQDVIHLLGGREFLSPQSWLTLARSLVLLDDLTKAERLKESPPSKAEKLNLLTRAHSILTEQMLTLGETIESPLSDTEYASPLQPLKNVYLPHVMLLAKIKMRLGHTVAKQVYARHRGREPSQWLPAMRLLETAWRLCKMAAGQEPEVEAEILFQKGKIERQMLMEEKSPSSQLESFYGAIQLSLRNDQNSGLIRDAYLEMALLYFHLKKPKRKTSGLPSTPKPLPRRHSSLRDTAASCLEMYSTLAWIAIRAAAQVSEAVLAVNLLIGRKNTRDDKINQLALSNVPEFAILDLLSSYTDYLLDNYQVAFQTYYPSLHQSEDVCDGTNAGGKTQSRADVTWVLLLRYHLHLQRTNSLGKLLASATPVSGLSLPDDTILTSLFNAELILRQKEVHFFLKKFLQLYSSSCIEAFPKELLQGLENLPLSEKDSCESSVQFCRDSLSYSSSSCKLTSSPSNVDVSSEMATQASNSELCFQWYIPPLDRPPKETEPLVLLLYACNQKPLRIVDVGRPVGDSLRVGTLWLSLSRVISIHEKLSNLVQIAELSLPATPEIASENLTDMEETEEKSTDKELENTIAQCCSEIVALLSDGRESVPLCEVPFDVSLPNIFSLERLFDLANGCVVPGGSLFDWMVSIVP
ncbi:cilia- and flagella-associated protein 54 [Carlito syrichta]|uniref:Cilia- and flagella-associated protein 54 n=1 Tax=Carlito syrichta TaxID=1868482 RepID=A0A3Q0DK39_CARSF|nr:cilia- and flagella-associated protein 54 [Carlito syrichta]